MASTLVLLHSIPPTGKTFVLDDQSIWTGPLAEFSIPCLILEPVCAKLSVQVQDGGVLVRGSVKGKVALPCNRCAEDAEVAVDQAVDTYEPFPVDNGGEDDLEVDREFLYIAPAGHVEMNLAALAWEEFLLALPMKPLCDPGCKGLCPRCGANKNMVSCSCESDTPDPRLAVLRGLKVGR